MGFRVSLKSIILSVRLKSAILMIAFSLLGCAHERAIRLWVHDADRGLFIRDLENKDVLTYGQGHGLICFDKKDMRKLKEKENSTNKE